jgi:3-oxoacyl-[acyl-carrier-protein] synthase-1
VADEEVLVLSVGMMTAVGLTAPETAASVRAGTMRFIETSWLDKAFRPLTLAEVLADGLPDLEDSLAAEVGLPDRVARLLRLASLPLLESLRPLGPSGKAVGLILALPETETALPLDRPGFLKRLARQTRGAFDPGKSDATRTGRAGGLLAVGHAAERVRKGEADLMAAGGVDSYRSLYILGRLDADGRVKSDQNLDGFIPGEGAGFVLLGSRQAARAAGREPLAVLSPAVRGSEEGHIGSEKPYRGEGLAAALAELPAGEGDAEPFREVYASMNGENYWAKEWGVAFLRNRARFSPDHRIHHPADCFGDVGAAAGPLLAGLAALGLARGYRRSPCLVYASSDSGERAVVGLRRP